MIFYRITINKIYFLLSLLIASALANASNNQDDDDYIPPKVLVAQPRYLPNVFVTFNAKFEERNNNENPSLNRSSNTAHPAASSNKNDDDEDDNNNDNIPFCLVIQQSQTISHLKSILKKDRVASNNPCSQDNANDKKRVRFAGDIIVNQFFMPLHPKQNVDRRQEKGSFFTAEDVAFRTPGRNKKRQPHEDELEDEDEQLDSYVKKASVKSLPAVKSLPTDG